jgi:hypothetical protein
MKPSTSRPSRDSSGKGRANCLYYTPRFSDLDARNSICACRTRRPKLDGKLARVGLRAIAGFVGRTMLRTVRAD